MITDFEVILTFDTFNYCQTNRKQTKWNKIPELLDLSYYFTNKMC